MNYLRNMAAKLWTLTRSKKLAIILISALTVAVTMAILPAFKGKISAAAALESVFNFQAWWFQALCFLLLLNLVSCTAYGIVRRARGGGSGLQRWGSPIFHVGLIVVMGGAFTTSSLMMAGTVRVFMDETTKEVHSSYVTLTEGPLFREQNHLGFGLTLLGQKRVLDEEGKIADEKEYALIRISDNNRTVTEKELKFGENISYRGVNIFNYQAGYGLKVTIKGPGQKDAARTIPLKTEHWPNGVRTYYNPNVTADPFPFKLSVNFYPDLAKTNKLKMGLINNSFEVKNPAINITASEGSKVVGQKLLRPGEELTAKGYSIRFDGVKPWSIFRVVRDPGGKISLAGVVISITGLFISFLGAPLPRRKADQAPADQA